MYRSFTRTPSWTVVLSDGTVVAVQIGRWGAIFFLDVSVRVTPVRKGGLAGLCGTNDGQKLNDLRGAFGNSTEGECKLIALHVRDLSCVFQLLVLAFCVPVSLSQTLTPIQATET